MPSLNFITFGVITAFFQFHHFLAVSSAYYRFRPQIVHFHTAHLPQSAPHVIEWFKDLQSTIPLLQLHETAEAKCIANQMPSINYLKKLIATASHNVGQVFIIQEDVVVNKQYRQSLQWNFKVSFVVSNSTSAYLFSALKQNNLKYLSCISISFITLLGKCANSVTPSSLCERNLVNEDFCIHFASSIFLRDTFTLNTSVAMFIRHNYYGSAKAILPNIHTTSVIPRIGHYVYMGKTIITTKQLSFEFFMSILSLFGIAKLDCVYIHGTVKFKGIYWDYLMSRNFCVRWLYFPYPKSVWQQQLTGPIELIADIVRAQIFVQYGGLHMDPDIFILRQLPQHYWRYEAVLGYDAYSACPKEWNTPDEVRSIINLGICMSMPGSRFFAEYQKSQKNYFNALWLYNSGQKPLHIYERDPTLAFLDPKLQVMCTGKRCCPSWARTKQEAQLWSENIDLWLEEALAVHVVWPSVDELMKPETIRRSHSAFGRIASRILAANNIDLEDIK